MLRRQFLSFLPYLHFEPASYTFGDGGGGTGESTPGSKTGDVLLSLSKCYETQEPVRVIRYLHILNDLQATPELHYSSRFPSLITVINGFTRKVG